MSTLDAALMKLLDTLQAKQQANNEADQSVHQLQMRIVETIKDLPQLSANKALQIQDLSNQIANTNAMDVDPAPPSVQSDNSPPTQEPPQQAQEPPQEAQPQEQEPQEPPQQAQPQEPQQQAQPQEPPQQAQPQAPTPMPASPPNTPSASALPFSVPVSPVIQASPGFASASGSGPLASKDSLGASDSESEGLDDVVD